MPVEHEHFQLLKILQRSLAILRSSVHFTSLIESLGDLVI